MLDFYIRNDLKMKSENKGFSFQPSDGNRKARTVTTKEGNRMDDNFIIVHNMQPRSGDPSKGGTGPLSRIDGKTYCLDTGNTNAIEIIEQPVAMDYRHDIDSFRPRKKGKTPTLCTNEEVYVYNNHKIRRLTPVECERLQTVPDNYTEDVSDTQRYRMLGNGWTVDVVKHFFEYLPFLRYEEENTSK